MRPIRVIESAEPAVLARFDVIVDVRSPGEFAQDHVPGAVNLPVLSDAERAEVGTIYVQESRFRANRIGAAYVAANIARHLTEAMADWPAETQPLIYCWRGGNRSGAMATILQRVGWHTAVLAGGYRTWRRHVQARLYDQDCPVQFVLLDGDTGSAKTELLARLAARGVQTLDLEGLAAHRGSLLGALADRPQPDQKLFETRLLTALDGLDPARPVIAEAESSKIGDRVIPPAVWRAMQAAARIEIVAPRPVRAAYLVHAYADLIADPDRLEAMFDRLPIRPSPVRREAWRGLMAQGRFAELAEALMELHYDPAYARARRKDGRTPQARLTTDSLDDAAQDRLADEVARSATGL
ncbi:tRNA 2-selenouridine(34) synthase MnmH [Phenylobacterium sp.]|jgi:tRNA 2-selenouridine synthase|uniref:tRNA 2-selenouridine(34) synthase MnmH n=1 Tax=Phenylobacterium sp. TaxID=1871053 RepID=UPI0037C96444